MLPILKRLLQKKCEGVFSGENNTLRKSFAIYNENWKDSVKHLVGYICWHKVWVILEWLFLSSEFILRVYIRVFIEFSFESSEFQGNYFDKLEAAIWFYYRIWKMMKIVLKLMSSTLTIISHNLLSWHYYSEKEIRNL